MGATGSSGGTQMSNSRVGGLGWDMGWGGGWWMGEGRGVVFVTKVTTIITSVPCPARHTLKARESA